MGDEARNIHDDFHINEEHLRRKSNARQAESRRKTNLRMAARTKIKQTKALSTVPMFTHLKEEQIEKLVNKCVFKRWKKDDVICRQGDDADRLYIIAAGDCDVSIFTDETRTKDRVVSKLHALDFFGESSLLGLGLGSKDKAKEGEEEEAEEKLTE